jgi:hypothetical protein
MFADWQMQQKALKDADRKKKKEAAENLSQFRGLSKEQELLLKDKKEKEADKAKKIAAAESLHNFKGATQELEFQQKLKQEKDKDKKDKKSAQDQLHAHHVSIQTKSKQRSSNKSKNEEEPRRGVSRNNSLETPPVESQPTRTTSRRTSSYGEYGSDNKKKEKKKEKKKKKRRPGKLKEWNPTSPTPTTERKQPVGVGKSRETVDLIFSFGLITSQEEDKFPDGRMLDSAAKSVIPQLLSASLKECNIRVDSKIPKVSGDIEEDAWFEGEGSIRWKVSGSVPVKLFKEDGKEIKDTAGPIQQLLKRYTSWRLVDNEWKRVREGRMALGITF